jgi:hypothetical protein
MADPRPQFLRSVTIRDRTSSNDERFPVHVGNSVLLDGEEHADLFLLNDGWTAEGGAHEGTVLSLTADATRVTVGRVADGKFESYRLDDIPVLVPRDAEWEFLPVSDDHPPAVRVQLYVEHFGFDVPPSVETAVGK